MKDVRNNTDRGTSWRAWKGRSVGCWCGAFPNSICQQAAANATHVAASMPLPPSLGCVEATPAHSYGRGEPAVSYR